MMEIKTLFKISDRLEKAFKEINEYCTTVLKDNGLVINNQYDQIKTHKIRQSIRSIDNLKNTVIQKHPIIQKPKMPLSPYFLFLKYKRDTIKKEYPQLSGNQIANLMGQVWKSLNVQQKLPFEIEFQKNKLDYEKKIRLYYQNNNQVKLQQKNKKQKMKNLQMSSEFDFE